MPFLKIETNIAVDGDRRRVTLAAASRAVAEMLGKPEHYVMVALNAGTPMLFGGSDAPCVYMELKSIGLPDDRTADFSRALGAVIGKALNVPQERIYIEFSVAEPHLWGWNGETF
jgi:phenylpyruvate tautomerase PptA (4-oxalocrotonate tautomerase family)